MRRGVKSEPIKLIPNRVWRTYVGGKCIDQWRNRTDAIDDHFPEEWIASVVQARNPGREHVVNEGLSAMDVSDSEPMMLDAYMASDAEAALGKEHVARFGAHPGLLVKILDSAERLAIQVHPDQHMANQLFQSPFGKTEAWYFLGGRSINGEEPYVLCGFKPGITKEKWRVLFEEQDIQGMMDALHKVYPKPGDVFLIRGGLPHAIGPGNWMVEIQEPTDLTIRTERVTSSGYVLSEHAIHQGIGFDAMFDCFYYEGMTENEMRRACILEGRLLRSGAGWEERELMGYQHTPLFRLVESALSPATSGAPYILDERYSILIVLSGEGTLEWSGRSIRLEQGDQFFLPASMQRYQLASSGHTALKVVHCYPPEL